MDTKSIVQVFDNPEFGSIRAMRGGDGEPWFVAKDVCDALGIRTDTVRAILDDDEVKETNPNSIGVAGGRNPLIVSEAGLYSLILKSRKPEAHAFRRWDEADRLVPLQVIAALLAAALLLAASAPMWATGPEHPDGQVTGGSDVAERQAHTGDW